MIIRTRLVQRIGSATIALAISGLLAPTAPALADHKPNHKPGGGGGGEDPSPFVDTGQIVFRRDLQTERNAANIDILVVRDLGTQEELEIKPDFDAATTPIWSNTGDLRWILFRGMVDFDIPETFGIWAVREDDEALSTLHAVLLHDDNGPVRPHGARPSRDDQWLAYITRQSEPGRRNILIQRFDPGTGLFLAGSDPIQVLGFEGDPDSFASNVTWSPNGLYLVFHAQRPTAENAFNQDLFRIDLVPDSASGDLIRPDSSEVINLTPTDAAEEINPFYGVNGRVIFSRGADVAHLAPLNPTDVEVVLGITGAWPDWSPDVARIALTQRVKYRSQWVRDVFAVSPDGTGLVNITNTDQIHEYDPAWRPNEFDCNGNGLDDLLVDIADGTSADCNGNGVPDECEIAADPSLDSDGDGILDECQ